MDSSSLVPAVMGGGGGGGGGAGVEGVLGGRVSRSM